MGRVRQAGRGANERAPHGRASHPSRAAEADRHIPIVLDDDGNPALTLAVRQHPVEIGLVLLDVDVLERDVPPLIVVTGGLRVGSGVLAEDVDHGSIVRRPGRPPVGLRLASSWLRQCIGSTSDVHPMLIRWSSGRRNCGLSAGDLCRECDRARTHPRNYAVIRAFAAEIDSC